MRHHFRILAFILIIAAGASLTADLVLRAHSDGLSVDLLNLASRWFGDQTDVDPDRTAIIAIDEETYRQPPFNLTPAVSWTPEVATVLNAVLDGGVKVIGIDIINTQSLSYIADVLPKGDPAADALSNYDRDFLQTLRKGAQGGRIVMSYAMQGGKPIQPNPAQFAAVGRTKNLRPTNMKDEQEDSVIRRGLLSMPNTDDSGNIQPIASLSLELFARANGRKITFAADGRPLIDSAPLPGTATDTLLLNFQPVTRDPPIYSLADLYACAQQGNGDFFKRHFAGRTVILGTVLDLEDRHLTSKRFATNPMGHNYTAWCALQPTAGLANDHASAFLPGAYILAAITDNLRTQNWLRPVPESLRLFCLFILALASAALVARTRAAIAMIGLLAIAGLWPMLTVAVFLQNAVLPLIAGWIAIVVAAVLGLAYRTLLIDRLRRRMRRSFSLYLPSAELERLVAQEQMPELGGELRPVTILFSDIASYSSLSEELAPADLVSDLNRYFGRMTEIVQRHGGFVDKFIGDGILAVFGAPLADADHALAGVQAALDMCAACDGDPQMTINGRRFGIRVGVHSGEAIVGNIGAPDRFNYTVVGDSVNLASRLEGVGKRYHTTIIVSEQTRQMVGDRIAFRELDLVRVVGRDHPVRLFLPLPPEQAGSYDMATWIMALSAWRMGDFATVATICEGLAEKGDEIAAGFAQRARQWLQSPPTSWTGIVNLSEK
ncbi:MAG TPA: adenylate/guanylate cyclase domain-containing protein [Dongiaceae bacterium]|nr:adenylate/guanylate cyclase domain-containing protein [Dongiaceae bacterium]